MGEFLHRLRDLRSRFRLRDEKTQLALVSAVAAIVIVAAVVALPGSGDEALPADRAAEGPDAEVLSDAGDGDEPPSSGAPGGDRSTSVVSGPRSPGDDGSPSEAAITATEVKVGITYVSDPGGANAAAGFTIGQVDQRRGWEAVIADINADPAFGRKVVPVWYSQKESEISSKGGERVSQEACAKFTQDTKVFMVWVGPLGSGEDTLSACLTKAKVPLVAFGAGTSYSKTFKDFPYLVEPTSAAMDRMAAFYVDQLYDAGFFSGFKSNRPPYTPAKPADGKPRIGLIRYDEPSHKAGSVALRKALAARGLALCSGCEFEISYSADDPVEQLGDAGEINTAIQNCKSRPGGACTHMLFLGSAAQRIPTFFIDGAERQQYRPRIGFSPLDSWSFVRDFLGPQNDAQFRQSQLVTWTPTDIGGKTDAFSRCKKLFVDAGETFEGDEAAGKETSIASYCDTAWYHRAAMEATGPTLNLATWTKGVEAMTPVPAAGSYLMRTKPGRHDGIGAIRIGEWSDECTCFKPASGVIPV